MPHRTYPLPRWVTSRNRRHTPGLSEAALLIASLMAAPVATGCRSGGDRAVTASETKMQPEEASGIAAPSDVAAPPANAERTASGLASRVLTPGKGTTHPGATDDVTVHYTGWTTDGKMFDSSVERGTPASFGLGRVIAGWTEGLQLMVPGEKRRFWIPEQLAYQGRPGAPAGMLVFDVELLSFEPNPTQALLQAPSDVAAAPADAETTASGLASKVLEPGQGDAKPGPEDVVTVHYTGWTTDGKMFDSSIPRRAPTKLRLDQVIAGWTEGLQLMVAGEKRRLWIPEKLAYGGSVGKPAGMLVFDIELISFAAAEETPKVETPKDVAKPPKDAERTDSQLASKVLTKGTGKVNPGPTSVVRVHYSGWTTDGKMFDSSVARGAPMSLPVDRLIPGFSEGLQLMVAGEKRRLWIPEALAYAGKPGRPQGMLVFDVELVAIER